MTLLNDFFTVDSIEKGEGHFKAEIVLNPSHQIYSLHFPGNPITPGVCILQIVSELLESVISRKPVIKEYKNVKYLHTLSPLEFPKATVTVDYSRGEEGALAVKAVMASGDTAFTKISALYE